MAKLNFKEISIDEEFEQCIPKILDELNIPKDLIRLRRCSKNENISYLLQECEIEDLSQEKTFLSVLLSFT